MELPKKSIEVKMMDMRKIKVCYVISSLCEGPTYVLHNIVRYIDYDKFDVGIITMTPEKETSIIAEFRKLPLTIHQLTDNKPLSPWMMGVALRRMIKELDPDIVHVHCPRSRLLSPLIPHKYKKVETVHNYPDLPKVLYGKVKGGSKVVHEESLRRFMHGAETLRICIFPKKYGQPLQQEISSPITSVVMPPEKIWRFMEQSRKAALYKRYSPQETIQRARSKLGKGGYLSSEHFAMWCKTGISESHQLNNMIEIMDRIIVY